MTFYKQRETHLNKLFIAVAFAMVSFMVAAEQPEYKPYFVSGILRLNTADVTLKIVQGMVISDSAHNAQVVFTVMATKQFPNYTVVDVLANNFEQLYKSTPRTPTETRTQPEKEEKQHI